MVDPILSLTAKYSGRCRPTWMGGGGRWGVDSLARIVSSWLRGFTNTLGFAGSNRVRLPAGGHRAWRPELG